MQKKAFTIIELLAVIIILGVLLMIAIPSLGGFTNIINQRKLKEDERTFEQLVRQKITTDSSIELNGSGYFYLDSIDKDILNGTYNKKSYVKVSDCKYQKINSTNNMQYICNKYIVYLDSEKEKMCKDNETWCDVKSIMEDDLEKFKEKAKEKIDDIEIDLGKKYYYPIKNILNEANTKLEFGYNKNSFLVFDDSNEVVSYSLYSKDKDLDKINNKYYNLLNNNFSENSDDSSPDIICEDDENGGCIKGE